MTIHSNLFKLKSKILPTCLQRNYRNSLWKLGNASYECLGRLRVKLVQETPPFEKNQWKVPQEFDEYEMYHECEAQVTFVTFVNTNDIFHYFFAN